MLFVICRNFNSSMCVRDSAYKRQTPRAFPLLWPSTTREREPRHSALSTHRSTAPPATKAHRRHIATLASSSSRATARESSNLYAYYGTTDSTQ